MLDATLLSDDPATNLQLGLAVELAVVPPYLYALWSIKPASEGAFPAALEAANSIRAVVYEEMLHAALVGNILNAMRVKPQVRAKLMRYPGPLPGHITTGPYAYTVHLAPLSPASVSTFKDIELPKWAKKDTVDSGWKTIADLYDDVIAALKTKKPGFGGGRQLPAGDNPGPGQMVQVAGLETALAAIETIIDQGEGHEKAKPGDPVPGMDDDHEMAHYEQFETIASYFTNKLIDATRDLYPVIADPNATAYSAAQQKANGAFNKTYTALIDSLQAMFDAAAPRAFGLPTELMGELGHLAAVLRSMGNVPTTQFVAGPTFEYLGPRPGGAG